MHAIVDLVCMKPVCYSSSLPLIPGRPLAYLHCDACTQAAYNNSSEVELNSSHEGEVSDQITQLGEYTSGTKVAKQFDGEWFEGVIRKYYAEEDLYWVLYSDGDSEDLDANEARQAMEDYRQHMQQPDGDEVPDSTDTTVIQTEDVGSTAAVASPAESAESFELQSRVASSVTTSPQACTSATTSYTLPAEMAVAMTALTAAAERLTAAADHIITQSSEFQQQQQQQRMFVQQEQTILQLQQQQQRIILQQEQSILQQQQQQQQSRLQQQQSVLLVRQQQQQQWQQWQHLAFLRQQQRQPRWYLQWH